ncbi:hypothetical protein D3C85_1421970 [compost metagenome]
MDVSGNISGLNEKIRPLIQSFFTGFGIDITQFTITSVTLPDEVLKYYDKVTGMNMITDIHKFSQFSIANAMDKDHSEMADIARQGLAMGMIINMSPNGIAQGKTRPAEDVLGRLENLKELFNRQLITEAEYAAKKEELLKLL